jgi:hypothetical protein
MEKITKKEIMEVTRDIILSHINRITDPIGSLENENQPWDNLINFLRVKGIIISE